MKNQSKKNMAKSNKDRAYTPEQKKEIMNRMLAVWLSVPELRLGQLISLAMFYTPIDNFYVEDYLLVNLLENYLKSL
jgi:hypothetical protein